MCLDSKKILLTLESSSITFLVRPAEKTQYFVYLIVNSTLQLISCISNDLQKLLKHFDGRAIVSFFEIPFAVFVSVRATAFSNNLAFYFKNLKPSVFAILLLKLDVPSLK